MTYISLTMERCEAAARGTEGMSALPFSVKVSKPGVSYELRSLLMRLSYWYIVWEKITWPTASGSQTFSHACQLLQSL